jgi:hypothetical protein
MDQGVNRDGHGRPQCEASSPVASDDVLNMFSAMVRPPEPSPPKLEDRTPRLFSLRQTPPGFVRMAVCLNCRHMAPLPLRDLVHRFGELRPVEMALLHLRCEECGQSKVEARLIPLCEPGCRRRR